MGDVPPSLPEEPFRYETAQTNIHKAEEFLSTIAALDAKEFPGIVAEYSSNAMNQAAYGYLIAATGTAPYKVADLIVAFVNHLRDSAPNFTGFGEDISYAYSLRTISVYDVIYRASFEQAAEIHGRARRFVTFCRKFARFS